jgi:hypothetical protein
MEVWQDVMNFEGYQISNKGRIKRLSNESGLEYKYSNPDRFVTIKRQRTMKEKILKPYGKYRLIRLYSKGTYHCFTIKRLVDFHFND